MTYFNNIKNLEELRKEYKRLVKINHPDNGGSVEVIKIINVEYEKVFILLKSNDNQTANREKYNTDIDKAIREVINSIIHLDIIIEVCGSWVWVSGNTYQYKEELKSCGFRWASKKKMWMWHDPNETSKSRGVDMNTIRNKYGSEIIKNESRVKHIAC